MARRRLGLFCRVGAGGGLFGSKRLVGLYEGDGFVATFELEATEFLVEFVGVGVLEGVGPGGFDFEGVAVEGPEEIIVVLVVIGGEDASADFGEAPDDAVGAFKDPRVGLGEVGGGFRSGLSKESEGEKSGASN